MMRVKGIQVFLKFEIRKEVLLDNGNSFDSFIEICPNFKDAPFNIWRCVMAYLGVIKRPDGGKTLRYIAVWLVNEWDNWSILSSKDIDDLRKLLLGTPIVFNVNGNLVKGTAAIMPIAHDVFEVGKTYDLNITHWEMIQLSPKPSSSDVEDYLPIIETMYCLLVLYCDDEYEVIPNDDPRVEGTNQNIIYVYELARFYWKNQYVNFTFGHRKCVKVCLDSTPYKLPLSDAVALNQNRMTTLIIYIVFKSML